MEDICIMREISENNNQLSDADFEQYDRQIRLWGVDSQRKLKSAQILIVGLGGYGAEVAKNIILMGFGHVTLMDHEEITPADVNAQLLVQLPVKCSENRALASLARAQQLNPKVIVSARACDIRKNLDMVKNYDLVFLSTGSHKLKVDVNNACREYDIKFMCGSDHGFYSAGFMDLGKHDYVIPEVENDQRKKEEKSEETTTEVVGEEAITFLGNEDDLTDLGAEVEIAPDSDDELVSDDDVEVMEVEMPSGETGNNKESGDGKKFLVENYCSYEDAVSKCDWTKRSKREMRQSSAAYFVMRIVERFFENHNRYPKHDKDDYILLQKYKSEIMEGCNIYYECHEDFFQHCIGSLSPVVAISAGVVAQEMLKAITQQSKPHCNFFFFDGQKKMGIVDYIGPPK